MNIFLVDTFGFTKNELEEIVFLHNIEEIIDARMNYGRIKLKKFYNNSFSKVRYIIKLANSTTDQLYPLEFRDTNIKTEFSKDINKLRSKSGEIIGIDKLSLFLNNNFQVKEKYSNNSIINKFIINKNSSDEPFDNKDFNVIELIEDYKKRKKRIKALTSFSQFKELLNYLKYDILKQEELKCDLGINRKKEWEEENIFNIPFEKYMDDTFIKDMWEEEKDLYPWFETFKEYMDYKIEERVLYKKRNPERTHFFDVDNICIFYNNPNYRELFIKLFAPIEFEYEQYCKKTKPKYDKYDTRYEEDIQAYYDKIMEVSEDIPEHYYFTIYEYNKEEYLEYIEDFHDEIDNKELELKKKQFKYFQKKYNYMRMNVDEGVWKRDEEEKLQALIEQELAEREYYDFWNQL